MHLFQKTIKQNNCRLAVKIKDKVTNSQIINGQHLFFDVDGRQIKGKYTRDENGTVHYYDPDSGKLKADS